MKDIDEIRRENLRKLEIEAGGVKSVADRIGMSVSQFANLRDGAKDSKTGRPRGMRKETARKIEESLGKTSGWLDINHVIAESSAETIIAGALADLGWKVTSPKTDEWMPSQFNIGTTRYWPDFEATKGDMLCFVEYAGSQRAFERWVAIAATGHIALVLEADVQSIADAINTYIAKHANIAKANYLRRNGLESEALDLEETPQLLAPSVVPIVGHVQAGDDGYLVELEYPTGHGDGVLMHYSKDLNAYALRVKGDSMRPRIKPGEFIVCEPNRAPYPGDDVVVKLLDGRRMVKEYQWQRDGDICFGSINADFPPIVVSESIIDAIHYVAAIMPRGAFVK